MARHSGLSILLLLTVGCSKPNTDQQVSAAPEPIVSAAPTTSASTKVSAPAKPPPPPTLKPAPLEVPDLSGNIDMHTIGDAVLVISNFQRVGRLKTDGVEWLGKIPPETEGLGKNSVSRAFGQWPDDVGVVYHTAQGRAPEPTYFPLTGKDGGWYTFAPGGGLGIVAGYARVGETTTIAGMDMHKGHRIVKVRGPMVKPQLTPAEKHGCEGFPKDDYRAEWLKPAVEPFEYAATRKGTFVSLGSSCKTKKVALEVWRDAKKPAEITELQGQLKHSGVHQVDLKRGKGDTMFLITHPSDPLMKLEGGELTALPRIDGKRRHAFTMPDGSLFATDGMQYYELHEDSWVKRFELAWSDSYINVARLGERLIYNSLGRLFELKPTKKIALDPKAESVDCKTPFVHVYDVSPLTQKGHKYPDTAKRLSTLENLDAIQLVEFEKVGRRIGIIANDWPTAKAAWKLMNETRGKDSKEQARLICYAPDKPRVLEVKKPKK